MNWKADRNLQVSFKFHCCCVLGHKTVYPELFPMGLAVPHIAVYEWVIQKPYWNAFGVLWRCRKVLYMCSPFTMLPVGKLNETDFWIEILIIQQKNKNNSLQLQIFQLLSYFACQVENLGVLISIPPSHTHSHPRPPAGHAYYQHGREAGLRRGAGVEPEQHLQPLHLRLPGGLLHPFIRESENQQRACQ